MLVVGCLEGMKRLRVEVVVAPDLPSRKLLIGVKDLHSVSDLCDRVASVCGTHDGRLQMFLDEHELLEDDLLEAVVSNDEYLVAKYHKTSDSSSSSSSTSSSSSSSSSVSSSSSSSPVSSPRQRSDNVILSVSHHQDPPAPREACRLYVGSLPPQCTSDLLSTFIAGVMASQGHDVSQRHPVKQAQINVEKRFAFVEFWGPEETTLALNALRGKPMSGHDVRWGRPHAYVAPTTTTTTTPSSMKKGRGEEKHGEEDRGDWRKAERLSELSVGRRLRYKLLVLNEETWVPEVSKEPIEGRVDAVDIAKGSLSLRKDDGRVSVVMWTSLIDPYIL